MEDTGEEPLPLFDIIPERTDGSTRRTAHLGWHMVYAVSLLPVAGRAHALWLVATADGPDKKDLPHP